MAKQKWYKVLLDFWSDNLSKSVKKISIGFGSFLIVIITTITLPTPLFYASIYGAGISFGTMVIMSIFGKNGNGHVLPELEQESKPKPESKPKEKITVP